jgi:hypothetical protein
MKNILNAGTVSGGLYRILLFPIWILCLTFLLAGFQTCIAGESEWRLVVGRQPLCPEQAGRRTYRSESLQKGKIKQSPFQECKSDPDIKGDCFNVHGRLRVYNGAGVRRIWWIGTKHMLYIPDEFAMPESLESKLTMGVDIYADFLVCPLEKQKAGHMQRVCIEKAQHIVIDR